LINRFEKNVKSKGISQSKVEEMTSMSYSGGDLKEETGLSQPSSGSEFSESYPEISLLPLVHDILHTVEKDTQNQSKKNEESLLAMQKVQQLNKKISAARNHIHKMEGIDCSEQVQNQKLDNLKEQLQLKKQLIDKYKNLNMKLS